MVRRSDAGNDEGLLAIDARFCFVYKPDLSELMGGRNPDRCDMRILDAALAPGKSVRIVVRVQFNKFIDVDETEKDVKPEPNCNATRETWSFDSIVAVSRQVPDPVRGR